MLEGVDWAGLDDCFDGDLSNHVTVNETQIVEAHRDGAYVNNLGLNEIFVEHMSRSCSEASSHSSSYETPLSTIYPSPTRSMENLLSTHTPFFLDGVCSGQPSSPTPEVPQAASTFYRIFPVSTTSTRAGASNLLSDTQIPRCTSQCQLVLTSQLINIAELQDKEAVVALDMLLNLEGEIRSAQNTVMSCDSCLVGAELIRCSPYLYGSCKPARPL